MADLTSLCRAEKLFTNHLGKGSAVGPSIDQGNEHVLRDLVTTFRGLCDHGIHAGPERREFCFKLRRALCALWGLQGNRIGLQRFEFLFDTVPSADQCLPFFKDVCPEPVSHTLPPSGHDHDCTGIGDRGPVALCGVMQNECIPPVEIVRTSSRDCYAQLQLMYEHSQKRTHCCKIGALY